MQVRFSTSQGSQIVEDASEEFIGTVTDILVHPDSGTIEGFYALVNSGLGVQHLFCSAMDIIRFGRRLYVRNPDVLCDPFDIIRLHDVLLQPRPILGQRIVTESGTVLGRCKDLQFDTDTFTLSWLFPKKWWKWGRPIPKADIVEVGMHHILVKDAPKPLVTATEESDGVFEALEVNEPKMSRIKNS